jgi:TonB-dependent receptor-like protein
LEAIPFFVLGTVCPSIQRFEKIMPARQRRSFRRASQIGILLTWSVSVNARVAAQDTQGDLGSLTLEQLMNVQVEGAAMHPQALEDAPASVTLITAGDIHQYGYRTLAEALAGARGFSTNYNHTYTTVGVRGFDLPGDYASRFLVLVNGHNMADNVLNYMLLFGRDFPIDMDLIKRSRSFAVPRPPCTAATVSLPRSTSSRSRPRRSVR